MIIRVVLLAALAFIAWFVFLKRNRLPFHIVIVFGMLAMGGAAVLFPEQTDVIANFVGVGRGVDLITYVIEVTVLFVLIHYYTKFVELQRQMTDVVRELAILRAEVDRTRGQAASDSGLAGTAAADTGAARDR
jgi:small membrane protein